MPPRKYDQDFVEQWLKDRGYRLPKVAEVVIAPPVCDGAWMVKNLSFRQADHIAAQVRQEGGFARVTQQGTLMVDMEPKWEANR